MPRTQRHNNEHGRYVHASGAWWECGASCDPVHRDLDNSFANKYFKTKIRWIWKLISKFTFNQ